LSVDIVEAAFEAEVIAVGGSRLDVDVVYAYARGAEEPLGLRGPRRVDATQFKALRVDAELAHDPSHAGEQGAVGWAPVEVQDLDPRVRRRGVRLGVTWQRGGGRVAVQAPP
jgi:hypothetical protein